jgi:large subunit ribosomal protein L19
MITISQIEQELYASKKKVDMRSGDTVRVHVRIREGDKERVQIFEGLVIAIHRGGPRTTFVVRKVSYGEGVERIFPLHSPWIEKIEVVQRHMVRRAKLYFLRDLAGKKARLKPLRGWRPTDSVSASAGDGEETAAAKDSRSKRRKAERRARKLGSKE